MSLLETKKKRKWFVIWCIWFFGWLATYTAGGFYVLERCRQYRTCEYDFKLDGFIIVTVIVPLIFIMIVNGIMKVRAWINSAD